MSYILEYYKKQREEKFPLLSLLFLMENLYVGHQDFFPYSQMHILIDWLEPIDITKRKERVLKPSEHLKIYSMLSWALNCPESTIFDVWNERKDG